LPPCSLGKNREKRSKLGRKALERGAPKNGDTEVSGLGVQKKRDRAGGGGGFGCGKTGKEGTHYGGMKCRYFDERGRVHEKKEKGLLRLPKGLKVIFFRGHVGHKCPEG